MKKYKNAIKEIIRETIKEETQYQRFFKSALKKFGVSSPDEFESEERKKEFFDYVDNNWKVDNESINEDTEYQKVFKKVLGMFGADSPDDLEKDKRAKFFAYMDAIWDKENSKLRDEPSKEDVDALTEFHLERISEATINEGNARDFKKFVLQSLKSSPDDEMIKQAIEWFAGSVYGDKLPNNLHRDDVKGKHIKAVIKKIEDEMKDDPDWYGPKVMNAFLKRTGLTGAKRIMAPVKENIKEAKYNTKADVVNGYLKGDIDMKELQKYADSMGTGIATKKELESLLNNKFLRGMMADTHGVSERDIERKVKDLLKNKMYEGVVSEKTDYYNKTVKLSHGNKEITGDVVGSKTKNGVRYLTVKFGSKKVEVPASSVEIVESITETHWINPQAQKKLAKKLGAKMNDVEYDGFSRNAKGGKVTGYAYLPFEKRGYKLTVDAKTGEVLDVVTENITEDTVELQKGRDWDIGAGQFPTGTVFYNRKEEEHGDWKQLARVDKKGKIHWYDKSLPSFVKKHIEKYAKTKNESVITEDEIPIEKVKKGQTVSNPASKGNMRTNPPIFTVDKIEKRKGSRGDEIVLHGKDRFGKKQFLVRDIGKSVQVHES